MVVIFCYVFGAKVSVAESIAKFRSSCPSFHSPSVITGVCHKGVKRPSF